MPATKKQQQQRLTAAKRIIAENGGREKIDNLPRKPVDEFAPVNARMISKLMEEFAHERMTKATARIYIAKALRRLRGEVVKARRGGYRTSEGLPEGTRKCGNCETWNRGVSPHDSSWLCGNCGVLNTGRKHFLKVGEAFRLDQGFDKAIRYGVEFVVIKRCTICKEPFVLSGEDYMKACGCLHDSSQKGNHAHGN